MRFINGNIVYHSVTVKRDYVPLPTDDVILADATGGNITVTFDSPSAYAAMLAPFWVKKIDSSVNDVSVVITGDESGAAALTLSVQFQSVTVFTYGSSWWIL